MTPQVQREGWIDDTLDHLGLAYPYDWSAARREAFGELLRDAMAFANADCIVRLKVAGLWDDDHARALKADAHREGQEDESLEQPSPLRIVDSSASDHTSYDFNSPSKTPTPPPREQGDERRL